MPIKTNNTQKKFFPAIDIMRGFLAIIVLYTHTVFIQPYSGWLKPYGVYSVVFFFSISGFLLAYLATKEINKNSTFCKTKFYFRRMLRIWPNYFLYIILMIIILAVFGKLALVVKEVFWSLFFLGNINFYFYPIFTNISQSDNFIILWSLGVEEQFYILFPFFIISVVKNNWKKNSMVLLMIILLSTSLRYFFIYKAKTSLLNPIISAIGYHTESYFDIIFIAILFGIYRDKILQFLKQKGWLSNNKMLFAFFCVMIVWYLLTSRYFIALSGLKYKYAFWYILLGLFTGSVSLILSSIEISAKNIFTIFFIYLGKLSYGIYIYHMLFVVLLENIFTSIRSTLYFFPTTLLLTILFSHISYQYFEKYFRSISSSKFKV